MPSRAPRDGRVDLHATATARRPSERRRRGRAADRLRAHPARGTRSSRHVGDAGRGRRENNGSASCNLVVGVVRDFKNKSDYNNTGHPDSRVQRRRPRRGSSCPRSAPT